MLQSLLVLLIQSFFIFEAKSQFFPPTPEGITQVHSKFHPNVTIQYKETSICETTPGVKSYSGYIHLPPYFLDGEAQDYPINTFFWFFEARKEPTNAPLSVWLNGGPGGSSLIGLLAENGPCFVANDSNSTYINEWSWNNEVNLLYVDQPTQVGYSYDTPTNVTVDMVSEDITPSDFSHGLHEQNNTFFLGTASSQNITHTANSTTKAAHAMWHFAQIWFDEFPFYKPADEKVSLWTESYGGHYGPAFAKVFEEKTRQIDDGLITTPGAHRLHLDTVGIINGCVDRLLQAPYYLHLAYDNTYDIQAINKSVHDAGMHEWNKPGGVKEDIVRCRELISTSDPKLLPDQDRINRVCQDAKDRVESEMEGRYTRLSGRARFDITHPARDPFPSQYFIGYLNQNWVQKALGVPVNSTWSSEAVYEAFSETGDMVRPGMLNDIGYLLDSGIKVTLMYGDRDFACNWLGGEQVSVNIQYSSAGNFREAGYAPIQTNETYTGGQVRQFGNLSFSRIYQAGHMVPSYQPETAYKVFMRALFNKDIATGERSLSDEYGTVGPSSTWQYKNEVFPPPETECYILNPDTCPEREYNMVKNNTAVVRNYIVTSQTVSNDQGGEFRQSVNGQQVLLESPEL